MGRDRLPPQDILREMVNYDSLTGKITWRPRGISGWDKRHAGRPAFVCKVNGYLVGVINGVRSIGAHRVAFKYVHGYLPSEIDHINGIRTDNRIENLRAVSSQENRRNSAMPRANTSGHIGVDYRASKRKFRASITVNTKSIHLGYFDTIEEAISARSNAEATHGFHPNHGRVSCQ